VRERCAGLSNSMRAVNDHRDLELRFAEEAAESDAEGVSVRNHSEHTTLETDRASRGRQKGTYYVSKPGFYTISTAVY
jgi:hypothetical protein